MKSIRAVAWTLILTLFALLLASMRPLVWEDE